MKIVSASNSAAVDRLLQPDRHRDRRTATSVANIVAAVRDRGDAALLDYARRFDRLQSGLEVSPKEIDEGRRPGSARCAERDCHGGAKHREGRTPSAPAGLEAHDSAGRHGRTARHAARPGGMLRSRWTISPSLLALDDRHSGSRGRRARSDRRMPAARTHRHGRRPRGRRHETFPDGRCPGDRGARLRHKDGAPRRQDRGAGQPIRRRCKGARGRRLRHRFLCWAD